MLKIDIPGFGHLALEHLVTDYTGTLSVDGKLLPGVREGITEIGRTIKVHVITSDTFGTAKDELAGLDCEINIISGTDHDMQKESYVRKLGADKVIAIGNGRNDSRMLRVARLGIAVSQGEGCATSALLESDILVTSAADALGFLTNTKRMMATLRF